jgi:NAD(P)-dependent dehydrogenase (short-subunit alcohol dehydrogenase family)
MKDLTGKVAVVTGGASGIGLALCERFVSERMKVVVADIDEDRLEEVGAQLAIGGADVATKHCDTSSERDVQDLAQFALDRFGGAHVLCNNAGITGIGNAWNGPMEVWERTVGVNLYGVVFGVRAFLPIMVAQGEGHIVNTASMAGLLAMPGGAAYNVTKHGVVALSEGLYLELKATASPLEVSVLCPGWVKTHIMDVDPDPGMGPVSSMLTDYARAAVESGMAPAEVADRVWDAIMNNQFWILTHSEMREFPVARMRRAADQMNPPVALP